MSSKNLLITNRDEIRKAWNKTEQDIFGDIRIIKTWLETQKHIPEIPPDDMIEFFLTNCKFSIEKTKQNLDMYYTIRDLIPDLYRNNNPCLPEMEMAYYTAYHVLMPKLSQQLHRVTVIKYKDNVEPSDTDIRRLFSNIMTNLYEVRMREDLAMGEIFIIDLEHIKFAVLAKITPILLKQTAFILEKVQGFRMHAMHFLRAPSYAENIINLFKKLLSKKLSERVHTHRTVEDLAHHVPLELLPKDFGGQQESLDELQELWKKKFLEYKDRFDLLENLKVNEELRPEKLKNDELLGYYGNFKKIDTD